MALALPNPQSAIRNPQSVDWVTVARAADLAGLSERTWRRKAVQLAAAGSPLVKLGPHSGMGRSTWLISTSADPRLAPCRPPSTRDDQERESLIARYPVQHVELAYRKAFWLRRWIEGRRDGGTKGRRVHLDAPMTARQVAEFIVTEAKRVDGKEFAISPRSLELWHRAYYEMGPNGRIRGVEGLIPRWAPPPNPQSAIRNPQSRTPEAIDYFYSVYHAQPAQSVKTCHQATLRESQSRGWDWPPSYQATARWLRTYDRLDKSCLYRDGTTAYSKTFMPYIDIDWSTIQPGEYYVCDHTQCDFWVDDNGTQIRPWLTSILDCRSRCVTGWHFGASPHQDAILGAMRLAFRDWAVPGRIRIDQGKDFTSELITGATKSERRRRRRELGPDWRNVLRHNREVYWTGVLGELGCEVIYAIPYHAWSKGLVERWYRTFEELVAKASETYTGNTSRTRPEGSLTLRESPDCVPSLETARARVADAIELYHRTPHSALTSPLDKGGTRGVAAAPLDIWRTATRLRRAVDGELLALMQARGVYRVGPNGVRFRVGGTTLSYGATSTALRRFTGRDVFITLDPADCSHCVAYTPDRESRRYIDRLEANERLPADASIDEVREAIKAVNSRRKLFARAGREAAKRTRTSVQEVRRSRQAKLAELRRTGTDDVRPPSSRGDSGASAAFAAPNIVPVRTGFEGVSTPGRTSVDGGGIDRKTRDLAAAKAALGFGVGLSQTPRRRPRASDDLLRSGLPARTATIATDDGDGGDGTDAGQQSTDLLRLIGRGARHERRDEE